MNLDTIVALSTGQGGAISVIRMSGCDAIVIADKIFKSPKSITVSSMDGYTTAYGTISDEHDEAVDEVVISLFRAPNSYTGEDVVEISCHGSLYIEQKIIELIISHRARPAEPGEFTQRAYLAGKLDLVQAEAVADIIASNSAASHRMAIRQMKGNYSKEFVKLRDDLLHFASMLELELDFSEEDVEFADRKELNELLELIIDKLTRLVGSFKQGNALKNGVATAIVGSPNVGKSTLLNALVKDDRAIVSSIAGTTRDTIEECVTIGGVLFRFIDTAGIRQTTDHVESLGIERTFQKITNASLILLVVDATSFVDELKCINQFDDNILIDSSSTNNSLTNNILTNHISINNTQNFVSQISQISSTPSQDLIIIINKIDLISSETLTSIQSAIESLTTYKTFPIDAKSQSGIESLESYISTTYTPLQTQESVTINNLRHIDHLTQALSSAHRAHRALNTSLPTDLIATDTRQTITHISSIIGEITTNDILGNIFSKFCIGK